MTGHANSNTNEASLVLTPPQTSSNAADEQLHPPRSTSVGSALSSSSPSDTLTPASDVPNAVSLSRAPRENDSETTPVDDYSQALTLSQQGTSLLERYEDSGIVVELEEAIVALRNANEYLPQSHPMKAECLNDLGISLANRFERLGDLGDLDDAITAHQHAVQLTPDGHPDKPAYLNNIGIRFLSRFERLGNLSDLREAVVMGQRAVHVAPDDHPNKPMYLDNLGNAFLSQFERLGELADINEAITHHQRAVYLTPDGDLDKPGRLDNLGNSLQSRFERLGNLVDLEQAIAHQRKAVHLTPDTHPHKSVYLNDLGISLQSRLECLGDVADLDEAITVMQQAAHLTPDDHPMKVSRLNNLGNSFLRRFERLDNLVDLDEAITMMQQTIHLISDDHPDKATCLINLGSAFRSRFGRLNDLAILDEAITVMQRAVHLTPEGHPNKPGFLNNLGDSFQGRFDHLGDLADLDQGITCQQQAVLLTPDRHPDKALFLDVFGKSLTSQFERLGDLASLDRAITLQREAVRLTPYGYSDEAMFLNGLGNSLQCRFERLGDAADLDEAITYQQQTIRLTPDDHPNKPTYLTNLGIALQYRFDRSADRADIDEAITAQQQAIQLTPDDDHPDKPKRLDSLGISFRSRFERLGDLTDLDEAITHGQQAVHLTPDGHPDKPGFLSNLGSSFQSRFERLGVRTYLDDAINAQQRAILLTPGDHANMSVYLNNLGITFLSQLRSQPDDTDNTTRAQATHTFSRCAKCSSGRPSVRFSAAHQWALLCLSAQPSEAFDAFSVLVNLLPRVVWLGRTVEQRYRDISRIGNVMADAVTAAIYFGKLNLALEWMEQSRSIVWGQMLQLRTPLDELRQRHPNEAKALERISDALDPAGIAYPNHSDQTSDGESQSLEEVAQAHHRLAEEYDDTLARIRNLPGFSEFLQPKNSRSLCGAATSGPVVIVNAYGEHCDALVLLPHSSQVSHVPLPGIQASVLREMQLHLVGLVRREETIQRHYAPYAPDSGGDATLSDILEWLWSHVVEPILSYLELLREPTRGEMPHVTWCLTGPLTFLPIHAAGLYAAKDQPKIFDYVISSYTPTLTALLNAKHATRGDGHTARLLTVSQPATPGQNLLPGTVNEADAIQSLQTQTNRFCVTRLDDREGTVSAVLQRMKECNWIHLACHGVQDVVNPTNSAFLLIDNSLTLRDIMGQSFSHTEFAFLSACQTAKGDSKLPDEAIHLAAGMLMAGYGSVVATMWSIQDEDAPIVAEKFYEYLIEEASVDSGRAAYALHEAVAHLRGIRGEQDFASWAPFIHLGICSSRPLHK